ncbi:MAG: hypothetical protein J6U20_00415 [Fibrobacter sp.]|nr:hypothetical protein [Fibrobacter sp.]
MNFIKCGILLAVAISQGLAAETLFSNWTFKVAPGSKTGKLYVFSRGDVASGVTEIALKSTTHGVTAEKSEQISVGDSMTAVHDGIFRDSWAERRRTPSATAGDLGLVLPMYTTDKNGSFQEPAGFFSARSAERVLETPLDPPGFAEDLDSAMMYASTGFAYDSTSNILWIARGAAGVTKYDISKGANHPEITDYILNNKEAKLEKISKGKIYKYKKSKNASILDVAINPKSGDLWIASEKGMWIYDGSEAKSLKALDTSKRVTGVWMGGKPFQIIAEISKPGKDGVQGSLMRSTDGTKFKKVNFLDTTGKVQKKDIFANSNYTVSDVAFLGDKAYIAVTSTGGKESGYLLLDSAGVRAWETDEDDGSQWLNGFERGVIDRDEIITSITTFPLTKNITGIAVSTYGNGISVSADSGATWTPILNRARLSDNLGSIRMVPSVITEVGAQSLVSYKVSKPSKITIEVFSYDMRKVRKIVKDAPREADNSRSTYPKEDFWDGLDDHGRPCTMGIYYVRVKDNHGHIGWGKVMTMGGR